MELAKENQMRKKAKIQTESFEIPVGYKMTELGLIPEDWEVKAISTIAPLQRGFDLPSSELKRGTYPVVYSNGVLNHHIVAKIKGPGVVTGRSGTIGKVHFIKTNYWPHNTTLWVTNFKGNHPRYTYYLYQYIGFERFSTGSGVPTLNRNDIHSFKISVPPTKEQEKIADILNDIDSLITSLNQLIAKKREIKKAAMHCLLTGKQRFPGFSGVWKTLKLGDIGTTFGGLTGKSKEDFNGGTARYIPFLNIMNNVIIDPTNLGFVRVSPSEGQHQIVKGDLFFNNSSETPEELGMCSVLLEDIQNVYLNSFCFGFRLHKPQEVYGLYLTYYFRSNIGRKLFYSLAQGSTRYNLSKNSFSNLLIHLPDFNEQISIANVLYDIDAEISAIKQERNKTCDLKQGMMQELLTGRIRLK